MFDRGVDLIESFCEYNGLRTPEVTVVDKASWCFDSTCAYYRAEKITICIERCAHVGTAARAWSCPGYVIDRTPYGVMAHELGHHVDYTQSVVKGAYGGDFSRDLRAWSGEPKLTNYCPNDWEWFAEMFRLFATNSDLLRAVRPKTHKLLLESGLKPVITKPWREVLEAVKAPERTLEMAERKAA
jgi:hypothetical protein